MALSIHNNSPQRRLHQSVIPACQKRKTNFRRSKKIYFMTRLLFRQIAPPTKCRFFLTGRFFEMLIESDRIYRHDQKKLRRIFEAESFNLQDKNFRLKNVQQRLTDATKWCWTFCLSEWSSFYLNIVQWINALWLSSSDLYPYSLLLSFNSLNIT